MLMNGQNLQSRRGTNAIAKIGCKVFYVIVLCLICGTLRTKAQAQGSANRESAQAGLPNAPRPAAAVGDGQTPESGTATLSGTVLDTNQDIIQNAQLVLSNRAGGADRTLRSGSNGEFSFAGVLPGTYRITATGRGMGAYSSPWITVHGGEMRIVPDVVLPVAATSTSVTVTGDKVELAEEQVKIAEEQRVYGVLPNFYSSYDWNAPPMMAKQKFKLAFRSLVDPVAFLEVAGIAGAEQYNHNYPGFGYGIGGYGKRYAAAYATDFTSRMLGSALFPAMFHQDPRYFYKGTGTVWQRTGYAISSTVMTRNDEGKWRPAYAHLLGNFVAGGIANFYYPGTDRGVGLTLTNSLVNTAANAGSNLIREFVLKGITSHAGGKP
jgi:hypothetical protein